MSASTNLLGLKDYKSNPYLNRLQTKHRNVNRASSFSPQTTSSILHQTTKLNRTFDASSESLQRTSTPKHELYKQQKQSYENAKKRITSELDYVLKDPSVVVVSNWLKVRGTLRHWTKLWAVLKPGYILLYRNPVSTGGVWVGTVVLSSCEAMQRPSKRSGFCFKIWHPMEKSIWAQKGPNNEQFGALTFPLPMNYLICRASDETTGRCWMDALELTMKCSKLLKKPYSSHDTLLTPLVNHPAAFPRRENLFAENEFDLIRTNTKLEDDRLSEASGDISKTSRSNTSQSEASQEAIGNDEESETTYTAAPAEEMGELGNEGQTEEVAEENKSLILHLLKQVRPGMDLSKVVLPTFILEPRSFLEKLADYYQHCDILEGAVNSADPLERMKTVVKFYLSGFYKKPKGLKKPYNPVLGEAYRCYFHHTKNDSKTFYIAEQISHHPPIASFYVSNRQEGFCVQGSIVARSKFYGNSLAAILDGTARLTLLSRGEEYVITMPYANCKGILIGRLTMELGGKVSIVCEKTRYSADIEFKLKPFIGGQELTNLIEGKIRLEKDVLYTFSGHWDDEITMVDKATNVKSIFWKVTPSVINSRLKRYVVPLERQQDNESEKLWQRVTSAVRQNDQTLATEEKTIIEDEQRRQVKERKLTGTEWHPRLFSIGPATKEWTYNHADMHPWNSHNDISTCENNFIIRTVTRYRREPSVHHGHEEVLSVQSEPSADDRLPLILKEIEANLLRTSGRLDLHEQQIRYLYAQPIIPPSSSYIHYILIIFVAIILKYIFR